MLRSIPLATLLLLRPWHHLLADAIGTSAIVSRRLPLRLGYDKNGTLPLIAGGDVSLAQLHEGPFWDTVTDIVSDIGDKVKGLSNTLGNISDAVGGISDTVGDTAGVVDSLMDAFGNKSQSKGDFLDDLQDAASKISDASRTVSGASNVVGNVAGATGDFLDQVKSLTRPVEQGGHSQPYINRVLCFLVGFVLLLIGLCYFLEKQFPQCAPTPGRPRLWLACMLLSSYAILIPGLLQALFSFTLAIELLGFHVTVTKSSSDATQPGAVTESILSVVGVLQETGSTWGAVLVVLYAMAIPALKLLLLVVGELWRFSEVPARVATARYCIRFVQMISKWACPDMFAYILLLYLLRSLDHRSSLIAAPAHLDDGFSCFSIFCLCSTFSSLAIPLPARPVSSLESAEGEGPHEASPQESAKVENEGSSRGLLWAMGFLYTIFAVLFCLGLLLPCMALRLDSSLLVKPKGPLPSIALPFLRALNLESQVNSEVSMWECVVALLKWWYYGEANCILALVMLGFFAMLLPVINMVVLAFAAEAVGSQAESDAEEKPSASAVGAMEIARIIKHVSMLDVAVMGVVVICLAGKSYEAQGIVFEMRWGLFFLVLAEVVHYVAYYWVQSATKAAQEATSGKVA